MLSWARYGESSVRQWTGLVLEATATISPYKTKTSFPLPQMMYVFRLCCGSYKYQVPVRHKHRDNGMATIHGLRGPPLLAKQATMLHRLSDRQD